MFPCEHPISLLTSVQAAWSGRSRLGSLREAKTKGHGVDTAEPVRGPVLYVESEVQCFGISRFARTENDDHPDE